MRLKDINTNLNGTKVEGKVLILILDGNQGNKTSTCAGMIPL
ncbi:hypothetical protein [Bacillus thuringiensis]|nr:hypothetical protein [Bacillus thuringiensis]